MNRIIFISVVACFLLIKANAQNAKGYVPGRVLVYFKEGHLNTQALNHNNKELDFENLLVRKTFKDSLQRIHGFINAKKVIRNARPDKRFSESRIGEQVFIPPLHNLICFEVADTTNIIRLCALLAKRKEIIYAQPELVYSSTILAKPVVTENNVMPVQQPNDPDFSPGLNDPVNHSDINALRAWDFTYGSSNIKVAIIDSGIDYTNPDLGGAYGSNAIKVTGGFDYVNQDSNPMDDAANSHGTGVAGIVGALTNNGVYVAGVAGGNSAVGNNGVQLIALKVAGDNVSGCSSPPCVGTQSAVEAIYDAATSVGAGGYGCHVINCSFGGTDPGYYYDNLTYVDGINAERAALSYAALNGVVLVAAKGNDHSNEMFYPADFADNLVISVGGMDLQNQRASFSNYGNGIDLIAPGMVNSNYTTGRLAVSAVQSPQGTSVAAPFVAGAAALLKSVNPNLHRDDVEQIIELSANRVHPEIYNYVNGYNDEVGHGKIDAGRALEMISAPYVLQQSSVTGGTVYNNPSSEQIVLINDAGNGLTSGTYIGKRYDVRTTITIPASLCNERYIWARTSGATLGWSAATVNNEMGYSEILSISGNTVTLRTWVFYVQNTISGQQINAYYPTDPSHVVFAYTTLINQPVGTISGPSLICSTGNMSLTSQPANTTINWTSNNSGLSINPTTGVATRNNNYNGQVTITSTVTGSCGSSPISKAVVVGTGTSDPLFNQLTVVCPSDPNNYSLLASIDPASFPSNASYTYKWYIGTSSGTNFVLKTTTTTNVATVPGGSVDNLYHTLRVDLINSCGTVSTAIPEGRFKATCGSGGNMAVAAYPNPTSSDLTIQAEGDQADSVMISSSTLEFTVSLSDSNGQVRKSGSSTQGKITMDVSDLPKGIYFLRAILSNGETATNQIAINK